MIRGLVIGKFLPPHNGHKALIEFAISHCEQLTIIVCDNAKYPIPGATRQTWLKEMHPSAQVLLVDEVYADDHSEGWAKHTLEVLGFTPDLVVTSEHYGDTYAKFMNTRHLAFDIGREKVSISGTAIRANPYKNWSHLTPIVRAYYVKRIAIVGAESCGKTTLAESLASELKTYLVPEYGRFYWDAKKFAQDDPIWTSQEFTHIATMQNICEDYAATRANKILVCDTNSFLTNIWHRRYLNVYSPDIDELNKTRSYDLTVFCPATIPFVQDGTRDGEFIRPEMSGWIKDRLESLQIPFVTMSGSPNERLREVLSLVKQHFNEIQA